ncbi:MAG: type II toxin-antitoxin system Phd/YefM family antitoxin [Deltaproteobacteria bacterium]|nr:type II toxin-antitoxin system Phd/YefM family antitoxin [Deltaproteobacteria bacterium]
MNASILDLRYKTKKILEALNNREEVNLLYHGKLKGKIIPLQTTSDQKIKQHPFFGMHKDTKESVEETMKKLRGKRYHDL